jgi:hypothetical protein
MVVQTLLEYLLKFPRDAEVFLQLDPSSNEQVPLDDVYSNAETIYPGDPRLPPFAALSIDYKTATQLFLIGEETDD